MPPYGLERIRTAAESTGARHRDPRPVSPLRPSDRARRRRRVPAAARRDRARDPHRRRLHRGRPLRRGRRWSSGRPFDVTWFMPEIRRLLLALEQAAPGALLVAGGAAFSAMPGECLDYLELEVRDRRAPARTVLASCSGVSPSGCRSKGVPGLVRLRTRSRCSAYSLPGTHPARREPLYAPVNSLPVRTRSGCATQCTYCLTANLLGAPRERRHRRSARGVEGIAHDAAARGIRARVHLLRRRRVQPAGGAARPRAPARARGCAACTSGSGGAAISTRRRSPTSWPL